AFTSAHAGARMDFCDEPSDRRSRLGVTGCEDVIRGLQQSRAPLPEKLNSRTKTKRFGRDAHFSQPELAAPASDAINVGLRQCVRSGRASKVKIAAQHNETGLSSHVTRVLAHRLEQPACDPQFRNLQARRLIAWLA